MIKNTISSVFMIVPDKKREGVCDSCGVLKCHFFQLHPLVLGVLDLKKVLNIILNARFYM